ncbi:hypothetical protein M9Y10_025417 [Tritrichomonas musculus]|uniref:BAR domain-containing protein n=1 Tax=Tritrichomonas musculus TaxID=1915356 RepID=A0ABR2H8L0_9EUKA
MFDSFVSIIKGPTVVKTIDPRYTQAKLTLKQITFEPEQMIKYIEEMEHSLQKLSSATYKLGEDIDHWCVEAPEDVLLEAKTNLSFTKHFSALTNNFLIPRAETHVLSLLVKYRNELDNIKEIREKVKKTRKEFDKSKAYVKYLSLFPEIDQDKMTEALEKLDQDNLNYSTANTEFIEAVGKLEQEWKEKLEKPFKNLLCITSQYMMQVFSELQKYRTTFPPGVFDTNSLPNKNESVKE